MTDPDPALEDPEIAAATGLLPAWFVPRMMSDTWNFAFLLSNGTRVHFETIYAVARAADGSIWIDVSLSHHPGLLTPERQDFLAPTSRLMASINAAHIVMAYETADT